MGFGFTSPVSGLAPIQIGWSGTLVPLRGTTLADGNDHKSHRESTGFQRQQGSNQTGSQSSAKAPAPAGRGRPRQLGLSLSWSWDNQRPGQRVGGWAESDQAAWRVLDPRSPRADDKVENATGQGERDFPLLGAILQKAERVMFVEYFCVLKRRQWSLWASSSGKYFAIQTVVVFYAIEDCQNDLILETFLLCAAWKSKESSAVGGSLSGGLSLASHHF